MQRAYPESAQKAKLETAKAEIVEETAPEALAEEVTEEEFTNDTEVAEEPNLADDQEDTKE